MTRFKDENYRVQNNVPKIISLPLALPSRSPASVQKKASLHPNLNNKQLYFLTLNDQFHQMGRVLKVEKIMGKRCPHFHSLNNQVVSKNVYKSIAKSSPIPGTKHYAQALSYPAYYPEIHLPLKAKQKSPTVYELAKKKGKDFDYHNHIARAFALHFNKTRSEIMELCETGTSDNYFVFENLNTLILNTPLRPQKEDLETLLKVSIVTNDFILKSIKETTEEYSVSSALSRIGSTWFSSYIKKILRQRSK